MSINGLNSNRNLIDATSINKVSQDLFDTLSKKSVDYSKADLSKFNRPTLGVDLYSSKTDIDTQRQISMVNSNALNLELNLDSVSALNSMAAQNAYTVEPVKEVGSKMNLESDLSNYDFISAPAETEAVAETTSFNPFSY